MGRSTSIIFPKNYYQIVLTIESEMLHDIWF